MSTITFGSSALGYTDGFTRDAERHLKLVKMPATDFKPVRLTRRGRLVLTLTFLAALLLGGIALGDTGAATDSSVPVGSTTITVAPGQTLWDIAASANPDGDVRETVDRIIILNALEDGAALQAGEQLSVPTYE